MISENLNNIYNELPLNVKLVAVSKFHPAEEIMQAYNIGQRAFGENRPQEMAEKHKLLPKDIEWHFIGHLQTNKLKLVLPFASLIQSIDSIRLLEAINNWGLDNGRSINVLLELHLGAEETKNGLEEAEIREILVRSAEYENIVFRGLMGMATNTSDETIIRADFDRISRLKSNLKKEFPELRQFNELSIGMSGDYRIALEYGATIIRIGTNIFGPRKISE
ncbi:MAG: YggS family pyridoxal phosphate-dependent enzyme [Candidatus Cryptobacteroides sp.]